ncbi:hypothetical protein F511_37756 [Dorcoceras hygrometricum]|uniref:Uncharacterized protein n=1 Tax=Dorcoceras hygrometricum TaxID=472368 RepID=A0A2Z7AY37_9LAMI|nr:hypothetical protein F511_37756 [Dorcoceras hygrometricum]
MDFGESAGEVEESNAIVGVVTIGLECLPPSCDGLTGPDDHGPMISRLIDRGIEADLSCQLIDWSSYPISWLDKIPPRRGGGRRTRRSEEESRAGSDDDAQVEDVTRQIGGMELVLARFQRTNPPTLAGTEGGARAEAWLVQMEELFDTLEYAPEKRLKLAVLQLRDDAQRWWRSTSRMLRDSGTTFEDVKAENKCLKDTSDDPSCSHLDDSDSLNTELISALNDMVHEYKMLSQTFEDVKAENKCLKDTSDDPSCSHLDDSDSLNTELNTSSMTVAQKLRIGSYELNQNYPTLLTQQKALNKAQATTDLATTAEHNYSATTADVPTAER